MCGISTLSGSSFISLHYLNNNYSPYKVPLFIAIDKFGVPSEIIPSNPSFIYPSLYSKKIDKLLNPLNHSRLSVKR